jgi:hypothetical protein
MLHGPNIKEVPLAATPRKINQSAKLGGRKECGEGKN